MCVHCSPWFLGQNEACVRIGCFGLEVFLKVSFLCIINVFHRENYVTEIASYKGFLWRECLSILYQFCVDNDSIEFIYSSSFCHAYRSAKCIYYNGFHWILTKVNYCSDVDFSRCDYENWDLTANNSHLSLMVAR